jgi:hypothetical protein
LSEQASILPPIPVLEATNIKTGERGRLTREGRRVIFVTDAGIRFGVRLSNIVNLQIADDVVELDTRLNGVTIRAVRFKAEKSETLNWFRAVFFYWVLSKRRESELALEWEPASYISRKDPLRMGDRASLEHDFLLARLVGNREYAAELKRFLGEAEVERVRGETKGFARRRVVARIASIEFEKMATRVFRSGWRESYETFDKGSPLVFQSALPTINQRWMREEFWGWYDVNKMLFDRFHEAERLEDSGTALVVKAVASLVRERVGDYAGLADDAMRRRGEPA